MSLPRTNISLKTAVAMVKTYRKPTIFAATCWEGKAGLSVVVGMVVLILFHDCNYLPMIVSKKWGVFKIVCHATPLRTQRIDN
jgi:hypothetical protein